MIVKDKVVLTIFNFVCKETIENIYNPVNEDIFKFAEQNNVKDVFLSTTLNFKGICEEGDSLESENIYYLLNKKQDAQDKLGYQLIYLALNKFNGLLNSKLSCTQCSLLEQLSNKLQEDLINLCKE